MRSTGSGDRLSEAAATGCETPDHRPFDQPISPHPRGQTGHDMEHDSQLDRQADYMRHPRRNR
jgi:hypothetical protein